MDFGVFEVASYSPSEGQLRKEAAQDKLAAAVYDVRQRFGSYLFKADTPQGFDDRAKLSYVDICKTIEPHLHARTGVYSKIIKTLKREWKQAVQTEDTMAQVTDASIASTQAGRGGMKPPAPPKVHTHQQQLIGKVACYPGCHEDEAHAEKFHKKDSDEKEARRRQAGPPVHQDPDRAHQVLDQTHQKVDEHAQRNHQIVDHTHELVDQRGGGGAEHPADVLGRELLFDPAMGGDPANYGPQDGRQDNYGPGGEPVHPGAGASPDQMSAFYNQMDQHFGTDPNSPLHSDNRLAARRYADDGAYAEHAPDHPELNTNVTFQDHQGDTLQPKGDFDGYLNSVDQGADSKVDHDFVSPNGAEVREHNESGDHNFVPRVTGSRTFQAIARLMQADMGNANMPTPPAAAPVAGNMPDGAMSGATGGAIPAAPAPVTSDTAGQGTPVTASYYNQISAMLKQAAPPLGAPAPAAPPTAPGAPGGAGDIKLPPLIPNPFKGNPESHQESGPEYHPSGGPAVSGGPNPWVGMPGFGMEGRKTNKWALKQIQEVGTKEARFRLLAVCRSHGILDDKTAGRIHSMLSRKVADSNYLQKADEALTKVLNEKAEEFQTTIAPLQQALITIQQAEQMANPLNVSPPAGTVNVLPGQQQPGAGAAAMDASGGGVGMGVDPAAAGLAGQPATQAMQAARKRGGQGKGRPAR